MRQRRRAPFSEDQLQTDIMKALAWMLPNDCVPIHVPNQGKRSGRYGNRLKAMGMLKGCPDLVFCYHGRFLAIELKKDLDSEISEDQRLAHNKLRVAGAKVGTARTLPELLDLLDKWGVKLVARLIA